MCWHQSGYGLDRADAARVCKRHGGATEVVECELVDSGTGDQVVVFGHEPHEVGAGGVAKCRDKQRAAAIALCHVDGHTETDLVVALNTRFAVGPLEIGRVHGWDMIGDGSDKGPCDQVSEAGFADAAAFHVAVDDPAVGLEHFGWNVTKAGCGRNAEAGFHVLDNAGRSSAERLAWNFSDLSWCCGSRSGDGRCCCRCCNGSCQRWCPMS